MKEWIYKCKALKYWNIQYLSCSLLGYKVYKFFMEEIQTAATEACGSYERDNEQKTAEQDEFLIYSRKQKMLLNKQAIGI